MEAFYRTHQYLLSHLPAQIVRRGLMDEIDWGERLIGIKGSRGVGKTTFLLSYANEHYGANNRECLYINLNHFIFTQRTLVDFAGDFRSQGGKALLIDQVFKYPNWSKELRECYDKFPDLKIVFTGSAVMRLKEENPDLAGRVAVYYLRGFSFREYLNLVTGFKFGPFTLQNALQEHKAIAREVTANLKQSVLAYFKDYLHHGFYPFFLEKRNYSENLLKMMNMTLEVDVSYIRQIEQRYLPRLRKLLYLISLDAPCTPNVTQLSKGIGMSRATVMNYIKYLKDARLLNLLYKAGEDFPKKPSTMFLYNTNLAKVINHNPTDGRADGKTFFFNQLQKGNIVNGGPKNVDFVIENEYRFCIREKTGFKGDAEHYYAVSGIEAGEGNIIPLWVFGFLY